MMPSQFAISSFVRMFFCAVGTVGLDFDGHAHLGTGLVQGFSGHVGVGDAVDTGGDGQHTVARLLDLLVGEALVAELGFFLRVDGGEEVFRVLAVRSFSTKSSFMSICIIRASISTWRLPFLGAAMANSRSVLPSSSALYCTGVLRRRAARLGQVTQSHLAWGR